jgi:hypothetical protein
MINDGSMRSDLSGEERMRRKVRSVVRERPLVAVAAATAVGAMLGGVLFSRLGRLVFIAATGYIANELWHREGRLDIRSLLERIAR